MNKLKTIIFSAILFWAAEGMGQGSVVKIDQHEGFWNLLVNEKPFQIKGVVGNNYPEKIREYGGNSVRMGYRREQLDEVHDLGLKVLVNLPAGAERNGMDYNDTAEVRKQTERIASIVKSTKDHPAVLMWAVGNELDYIPPYEPFNPKVWNAVNDAAKAIHAIDPDHPVMTVIGTSMMHKVADIVVRCPDIDLLGINTYGDMYTIGDTLRKYGWEKPYVITEWGPDGYWEVPKTPWGAPYEQTGYEKYSCYRDKYQTTLNTINNQCLGSFVFYWSGFKQETTHTWFCMFDENGKESPLTGLMQHLWTGRKSPNEAPLADSMQIGNLSHRESAIIEKGSVWNARLFARDPDDDPLKFKWEIRPEAVYASYAGQGEKVPQPLEGLISGESQEITFMAPARSGPYRLFAYVYDDHDHFSTTNLPFFVPPVIQDTTNLGRYTSRTLNLLKNSDPLNPTEVKILVYGQSISVQEWWLRVKKYVENLYPNASVMMENKAIGGFASQFLCKTVEMDVSTFYPDLVLLHIYGDAACYDSVLCTIRSRTAAEVVIANDHYTGENVWSDTMSYHILPALAEKYKCDLVNIRTPWKQYLEDQNLEPSKLLRDNVHLNDYGNLVMAELIKPVFTFRPQYPPDPFGLCTIYREGRDFKFRGKTMALPFTGNRAVAVVDNRDSGSARPVEILIDGKPPTSWPGTWFMSRPYNETGRYWPWQLPAMIRVRHSVPWLNEEWTCTFSGVEPPYTDFDFSIEGTVTGKDGTGNSNRDFVSPSGRVIISGRDAEDGGDWHLSRSFKVLKTEVNPGDVVKWKTYSIGMDFYPSDNTPVKSGTDYPILFQGIPNTKHLLKVKKTGKHHPAIKEIKIYKPFLSSGKNSH